MVRQSRDTGCIPSASNLRREMGAVGGPFWVLKGSISKNGCRQNQVSSKQLRIGQISYDGPPPPPLKAHLGAIPSGLCCLTWVDSAATQRLGYRASCQIACQITAWPCQISW